MTTATKEITTIKALCEWCDNVIDVTDGIIEEHDVYPDAIGGWPCVGNGRQHGETTYVNEYWVNQAYGGPEEGGWWYETGKFVQCLGITKGHVAARGIRAMHEARVKAENEGLYPITSVLCTGVKVIYIDKNMGKDFPEYRPHYE